MHSCIDLINIKIFFTFLSRNTNLFLFLVGNTIMNRCFMEFGYHILRVIGVIILFPLGWIHFSSSHLFKILTLPYSSYNNSTFYLATCFKPFL